MQFNVSLDKVNISGSGAVQYWVCAFWTGKRLAWQSRQLSALILQLSDLALPSLALSTLYFSFYIFCFSAHHSDVASCKGYSLFLGAEVPCTLNPRWSAGCPNRARSNSEGYAGGFQLGKLRAHNPCTIVPNQPHSLERAGSTRYLPADHQQVPGKPLSVNTHNYTLAPVFVVKVSRPYFFDESAGHARKIWSGDETRISRPSRESLGTRLF